jgi:hypothetical protein
VNDPGLWKRQFMSHGRFIREPVEAPLVATPTQPVPPGPPGMLKERCQRLDIATDTMVVVIATQFGTQRPILLGQWLMAVRPTPCPGYPLKAGHRYTTTVSGL